MGNVEFAYADVVSVWRRKNVLDEIQNHSDERNEPDVFHELDSLSLVCLMKSFTLPDFAKHEVGHK